MAGETDPSSRNGTDNGAQSPLRIYVTGATGFVGTEVVRAALARGHHVVAVVRPSSSAGARLSALPGGERLTTAAVDLRSRAGLAESLSGADTVIHLAAAKAGDFATQFAGTVVATENLLDAMAEASVDQLVGVSTFSVYDYLNMRAGSMLDERSPIDHSPALRDEYARTKLLQEDLYRSFGRRDGTRVVILRPGMIYGRDNLWHALLGAELGPRFLRIGKKATLPLSYVENCAEAMVMAAERLRADEAVDGEVINIVDDDLPNQDDYAELVAARTETPPTVSVPWAAMRTAAGAVKLGNQVLMGGRVRMPGIAVPDRLHARFKPLRYTNAKAKKLLGWSPRYGLAEAVERSVEAEKVAP